MNLSIGEKMVWAQVFAASIARGLVVTDAAIAAARAVLILREVPKIATWEHVRVDEREKFFATTFAQNMLYD